jgi:hypothetical protein
MAGPPRLTHRADRPVDGAWTSTCVRRAQGISHSTPTGSGAARAVRAIQDFGRVQPKPRGVEFVHVMHLTSQRGDIPWS